MHKNSKRIIFIVFSLILVAIFLSLGFWQLKRKTYKDDLIKNIREQIKFPSIKYEDKGNIFYRKFEFSGKFDNNIKLFVYGSNKSNQKNGYFFLTSFKLKNGKNILVLREWIQNIKNLNMKEQNNFEGLVVKSDHLNFFTPNPDLKNKIFYSFDVNHISQSVGINFENFFVIENSSNINIEKFTTIHNRHFEYIITWFTLAFFTFIMLITNIQKL
jgi:surfeit locus 1 family protein